MATYPLVFTYRDLVAGNGFIAGIGAAGRVLLTQESDGFWMSGVNPGSIAAGGRDRAEAFRRFKEAYLRVLFDIAAEALSFEAFQREVSAFFYDIDQDADGVWSGALAEVRAGNLTLDDLPRSEAHAPAIEVTLLARPKPEVNAFDSISLAEAA